MVDEGITCTGGLILAGSLAIGAEGPLGGVRASHTTRQGTKHSLIMGAGATGARSEGGTISGVRAAGTSPPFTCRAEHGGMCHKRRPPCG
jgi:hypothetical protein